MNWKKTDLWFTSRVNNSNLWHCTQLQISSLTNSNSNTSQSKIALDDRRTQRQNQNDVESKQGCIKYNYNENNKLYCDEKENYTVNKSLCS